MKIETQNACRRAAAALAAAMITGAMFGAINSAVALSQSNVAVVQAPAPLETASAIPIKRHGAWHAIKRG